MTKRLQVVVGDEDFERSEAAARVLGKPRSESVRETLNSAEREVAGGDIGEKLAAIRTALRYEFPAPDIDLMLAEVGAAQGN